MIPDQQNVGRLASDEAMNHYHREQLESRLHYVFVRCPPPASAAGTPAAASPGRVTSPGS